MNVENIPTYLKAHASWCNFRYEERKGNMTKVPYNPATGYKAYVNKPETFTDFETAVSELKDYDGLGIRVDGIIIAIDLDHCIKDGKLTTQAADIVSHFKNTYIERSPSGTGLRIILFVEDSYNYDKNNYYIKKGDIEFYVAGATNRFVTITGDVYLDNEIVENMDAPSEWQVFKDTHEAIISEDTFQTVKRIRDGRRRPTPLGEMPVLSGMVFCADCGSKLYQVRGKGWSPDKEYMVCANYRKRSKDTCTSHQIRNVDIENVLLYMIQQVTAFARDHEDEFIELVTKSNAKSVEREIRESKKEFEQAQVRISKLDTIIQRLYEDNIEGKISDERFMKMSATYEAEQNQLTERVAELEHIIDAAREKSSNADSFLRLVKTYTDIKELNAEIIRTFIEKVYVYGNEKPWDKNTKKIKVIFNFIGEVHIPSNVKTA